MIANIGPDRCMDIEKMPHGLLLTICRNMQKENRLGAIFRTYNSPEIETEMFAELKRRDPEHWLLTANLPQTCAHCDRVGLYRVGKITYCRTHKDEARQALRRGNTWRTKEADRYISNRNRQDKDFETRERQRESLRKAKQRRP